MQRHLPFLFVVLLLCCWLPTHAQILPKQYTTTDLGALTNPGASVGWGVNAAGQVTGITSVNIAGMDIGQAFFWSSRDGMIDLGSPLGQSFGFSINANGQIVGIYNQDDVDHAFFWPGLPPVGPPAPLQPLNPLMDFLGEDFGPPYDPIGIFDTDKYTEAFSINNAAWIAGVSTSDYYVTYTDPGTGQTTTFVADSVQHACLWQPGAYTTPKDLGSLQSIDPLYGYDAGYSLSHGINNSNKIVGSSDSKFVDAKGGVLIHACIWIPGLNGSYQPLDLDRTTGDSQALAINDLDQIIGSRNANACIWLPGTSNTWNDVKNIPSSTTSSALLGLSINNHSQVVGIGTLLGQSTTDHPFVWSLYDNKTKDLNTLINPNDAWTLDYASCISDSGYITGYGTHNGSMHAYRLNPVLHGFDYSSPTTLGAPPQAPNYQDIEAYYKTNYSLPTEFVITRAWGGVSQDNSAAATIDAAPVNYRKAAYALLDFVNPNYTGKFQVQQATAALNGRRVSFLAIDVENTAYKHSRNLPPGLLQGYSGGKANPADQAAARRRIAEAVQEIINEGYKPVIYSRDSNSDWSVITGASTAFKNISLWDVRLKSLTDLDLAIKDDDLFKDFGNDWVSFGGWQSRDGRQYVFNDARSGSSQTGHNLDLDIMAAPVFDDAYTRPPIASNVSDAVALSIYNEPYYSHVKGQFMVSTYMILKNTSNQSISGPLEVAFPSLPPGVSVNNPSDLHTGTPYICCQPAKGLLAPGESVLIPIVLGLPSRAIPDLTVSVFSGYF